MARSTPDNRTAADLADELRALDEVQLLTKARDNVVALEEKRRAAEERLADALASRAETGASHAAAVSRVGEYLVGAAVASPPAVAPATDADVAALRREITDLGAAKREQESIIRNTLGPAASRAAWAAMRPVAVADLEALRQAVAAFDRARGALIERIRGAFAAVDLSAAAILPEGLPKPFDAERSGNDGRLMTERLALYVESLKTHGHLNNAS